MAVVVSTLTFIVEPQDNIETLPEAIWFTMVTATSTRYADIVPKTTLGHIISVLLMISSALCMALPISILGKAFDHVWVARERLLLLKDTQDRLLQLGYSSKDMPRLFNLIKPQTSDSSSCVSVCEGDNIQMCGG